MLSKTNIGSILQPKNTYIYNIYIYYIHEDLGVIMNNRFHT